MKLRIVLTLVSLAVATTSLYAQQDVQLLRNLVTYWNSLPSEIQIQSASRIGDVNLVVWGSIRTDSHAVYSYRQQLLGQFLNGTTPNGSQLVINDTNGEPTEKVWVVSYGDRFGVFWNDNWKNNAGLYAKWYHPNGSVLIPQKKLSNQFATDVRTLNSVTDDVLLTLQNNASYLVHNDGVVSTDTVPSFVRASTYLMNADGSVYMANGLKLYKMKSLTDATVLDSVQVVAPMTLFAGCVCVDRDAGGQLYMHFLLDTVKVVESGPEGIRRNHNIIGYRATIQEGGQTLQVTEVKRISLDTISFIAENSYAYNGSSGSYTSSYSPATGEYCGGKVLFRCPFASKSSYKQVDAAGHVLSSGENSSKGTEYYLLEDSQKLVKSVTDPQLIDCNSSRSTTVERVQSSGISSVLVYIYPSSTSLLSSDIPGYLILRDRSTPIPYLDSGRISVSWFQPSPPWDFHIGNLFENQDTLEQVMNTGDMNVTYSVYPNMAVQTWQMEKYLNNWAQRLRFYSFGTQEFGLDIFRTMNTVSNSDLQFAYDPNTRELMVPIKHLASDTLYCVDVWNNRLRKTPATFLLNIHAPSTIQATVPVDTSSCYLITAADSVVTSTGSTVGKLRTVANKQQFQRLYGQYFLRFGPDTTIGTGMYRLERYSITDLKLLDTLVLNLGDNVQQLNVQQNPKDSAVVLMWSGSNGVHISYLTKALKVCRDTANSTELHNLRVSQYDSVVNNAKGVFRNDTLFIVWNDKRLRTHTDVFASRWAVPKTIVYPGTKTGGGTTSLTLVAVPNPSVTSTTLRYSLEKPSTVRITMYDMFGNEVQHKELSEAPAGNYEERIERGLLAAGVYLVRLQTDAGIQQTKLMFLGTE